MIGCDDYGVQVEAYLDAELTAEQVRAFETHLPDCAGCRTSLDAQRLLVERLQALPALEPSPQFEVRFWTRLAREEERTASAGSRLGRLLRPLGGWSLAAAALAGLALLLSQGDPALPAEDWAIVADAEQLELLEAGDLELLADLDVLEIWDGVEEI